MVPRTKRKLSTVALKDHKCNAYILQIQIRLFLWPFCLWLTGKHEARLLDKSIPYHVYR